MNEEEGMKVAELEMKFAEFDGYTAEARAGELLLGLDIPSNNMQDYRVLLCRAENFVSITSVIFRSDILLLDEPTNNLDINSFVGLKILLIAARVP